MKQLLRPSYGVVYGRMRHFGFLASLTALALLATACAQPALERRPFDVPTEVVPEWVNPADPEELFPPNGGCLVAVGSGVRVLEVFEDTAAHGVLRAGDIITSIDGVPTTSIEVLLRVLDGHSGGDVVQVRGTRMGVPLSIDIELAPAPGEPEGTVIGIIAETKLDPVPPSQLPASGTTDLFSRPVILDGSIYLHQPLAAGWLPYAGVPAVRTAALGSDLYAVAAADPLSLVKIGEGVLIPIDPGPVALEGPAGLIEVVASRFDTVLTSVGNLVLVTGTVSAGADTVTALHAVDPVERFVVWTRPLGLSPDNKPLTAVDGYRSPSGDRALVALVEYDPTSGARSEVLTYYLVDKEGEGAVGPPGIDRFFANSGVTGWFDEDSLLYVTDGDSPQIVTWALDTGDHSVIRPVPVEEAFDLVTVTPVGDGQHMVKIRANEVSLINVNQPTTVRPISRGCRYAPIKDAVGSQVASRGAHGES